MVEIFYVEICPLIPINLKIEGIQSKNPIGIFRQVDFNIHLKEKIEEQKNIYIFKEEQGDLPC